MIEHLASKLNASSYRGCVSEVGVGIPFSAKYVSIPGASSTILHIDSPYAGIDQPANMRAVSLENAKRMAYNNLFKAQAFVRQTADSNQEHLFGLAITGAHYTNRPSHAWVYLATPQGDSCMHFYTPIFFDRRSLGVNVIEQVTSFLEGCFFPNVISWTDRLFNTRNVDVIYAPGISDVERLLLLREDNPLAWNANGKLERVEDIVRGTSTVYSGSFNPPTRRHLQNANGCLVEISHKQVYKSQISIEDLLHRIRMLGIADCNVLVTKAPRFIDKYLLLNRYLAFSKERKIKFKVGVDTWNAMIANHQYPSHKWLGENMLHAEFDILPRVGYSAEDSPVTLNLTYKFINEPASEESSTAIRNSKDPHKHIFLTAEIADYIERHGLYRE